MTSEIIGCDHKSLTEFIAFLRYESDTHPGGLHLLAFRSARIVEPFAGGVVLEAGCDPVPDAYDDVMIGLYVNRKGGKEVIALPCTVDPGKQFTQDKPHPRGAAHLVYGQHLFVRGQHMKQGWEVFRPLNEINRVWRDSDGDFAHDADEPIEEGSFGVLIHKGGTSSSIGAWSAGCIAVQQKTPEDRAAWTRLLELGDGQQVTRLTLWPSSDLVRWHQIGGMHRPMLFPGTKGSWVAELQYLLRPFGHDLTADGDWREKTTAAVKKFQRSHFLKIDGIAGPATWSAVMGVR